MEDVAITELSQDDDNTVSTLSPEWETVNLHKAQADKLQEMIDKWQNKLANGERNRLAGKEVDTTKLLTGSEQAVKLLDYELEIVASNLARGVKHQIRDISAKELVADYWNHVGKRKASCATGFTELDTMLGGGFEAQRLMILLGVPGGGKTSLANQMACNAAENGRPVFYVTSEDQPFTLLAKTISRKGGIPYKAVLKGYPEEKARIDTTLKEYAEGKCGDRMRYLDASMGVSLAEIHAMAGRHFDAFKTDGTGILVVDYLQRIARAINRGSAETDIRTAVTRLTEDLRAVANDLDCTIIALASQNRSGYNSSKAISSAKESGDIEYTADVMMSIANRDDDTPTASNLSIKVLTLDKNRQGETGQTLLAWQGFKQQFAPYDASESQYAGNEPVTIKSGKKGGRH